MRIDDKLQFQQSTNVDLKARKASEQKLNEVKSVSISASATVPAAKDGIELSSASKSVTKIKQALVDLPDTRQDKVAELKARIASGSYNVSSEEIATKIVNTAYSDLF